MKKYLKLLRIKHYLKNAIILLPLLFSGEVFNLKKLLSGIIGVFVFSLISSIVYIINDIKDIENDKKHPIKKNRPLASGVISIQTAIIISIILLIFSIGISIIHLLYFKVSYACLVFLIIYIVINILYSFGLKNIPILDILLLSSGFLIRVLYGGSITNIDISNWLFLTVLSGTLYMSLGKRRNELIKNSNKSRSVLSKYNKEFLDKNMYLCLSMTIIFYCLWVVKDNLFINSTPLIYSVILIIFIMMRYGLIIENDSHGDPVDVLTSDKALMVGVLMYIIYVGVVLYV